ncbi:MAG: hypothetical protein K2K77_09325, partial [Duncaniella sp.]|nr:hypothetical protein [Duncaniella sp.]
MLQRAALIAATATLSSVIFTVSGDGPDNTSENPETTSPAALAEQLILQPDSIVPLTEEDFREVAERIGVEVAAIKAIVDIEAGPTHEGFS